MVRRVLVTTSFSFGLLVSFAGCTFLVSFDDPDASAPTGPSSRDGSAQPGDDDATVSDTGARETSVTDSSTGTQTGNDATGDDDEADASDGAIFWHAQGTHATPDASPLAIPAGCDPCRGYTSTAFTCGQEHNTGTGCNFDKSAIYHCDKTDGSAQNGYECPNGAQCLSAGGLNAVCDPCPDGGTDVVANAYTNSLYSYGECVTCPASATSVYTCDAGNRCSAEVSCPTP
jgi:hypothetical protein